MVITQETLGITIVLEDIEVASNMLLCDKTERSRGTLKSGLDITSGCPIQAILTSNLLQCEIELRS